MVSTSKLLVGSSSNNISGLPKMACASNTLTFMLAAISFISIGCSSSFTPRSLNKVAASLSAVYPPISPNSCSRLPAFIPSSSVKSSLLYRASFSCITVHIFLWPINTVFKTVSSSKANWF